MEAASCSEYNLKGLNGGTELLNGSHFMNTTPDNNFLKTTQNHYDLRNGKTIIIKSASKSADKARNHRKCPPLVKRRNIIQNLSGPHPLGKKGHLSDKYDQASKMKYIEQLYFNKGLIGEGSYGTVHSYLSYDDNKLYAVKVLGKGRYTQEIENLDTISGIPYCIQYHNAWKEDGVAYIQLDMGIMSLSHYAGMNHNITEGECWQILHDIANALAGLHEIGCCHMDVKPDNIVIMPDGKYKLGDFGLMTKLDKNGNAVTYSEGDAKYISSEMLKGAITTAGDIFSLGISIMEVIMDMLLPTDGELWHEIRNCTWRTISKDDNRQVSMEMENTLNWMMHPDPQNRPSAYQVLQSPMIKTQTRAKKTRYNYFAVWYEQQKKLEENECELVPKIVLNHDYTLERIIYDGADNSDNETIKTPPRLRSSVTIELHSRDAELSC